MKPRIGKKVLHAGRGSPLDFITGVKAIFDYQVQVLPSNYNEENCEIANDLPIIDDSRKKYPDGYGTRMELVFGKKFQIPIWEDCIKTMLLDEVASFDVPVSDMLTYPMVSKKLRDIGKIHRRM